jgi:homoserine acetyltransferase
MRVFTLCFATVRHESFKEKFNRDINVQLETFQVERLNYHGEKLEKRFQLSAYKMMNQLLKTIDITNHESLESLI